MFYSGRIKSIKPTDRVLEIGPGSTPHSRSDAFLELAFDSDVERIGQRGGVIKKPSFGGRPVHYYDGGRFPFVDGQFDYVICSHVVEHVNDVEKFVGEIIRVGGGRGYIEYPLITYDYLYDFDVHLHFLKFDFQQNTLKYLPKASTHFSEFSPVTAMFNKTLVYGWDDLCAGNKEFFFEGFEFERRFFVERVHKLQQLLPPQAAIARKGAIRKQLGRIFNKLGL